MMAVPKAQKKAAQMDRQRAGCLVRLMAEWRVGLMASMMDALIRLDSHFVAMLACQRQKDAQTAAHLACWTKKDSWKVPSWAGSTAVMLANRRQRDAPKAGCLVQH